MCNKVTNQTEIKKEKMKMNIKRDCIGTEKNNKEKRK